MTEIRNQRLQSKALKEGHCKRMLDFAIRGLPRHALPGEQHIDYGWAFDIYKHEIRQLDTLNIHPKWFSSGVLGAALISLALYPQTLELWRRLARHEVFRNERGPDAPGFLRELIERHQNDPLLTRNHNYQLFLFQTSLAVVKAWVHHDDPDHRYRHFLPIPDVAAMLSEVRKLRGERNSQKGFRPPEITRSHWIELSPPQVVHEPDFREVLALAKQASSLEGNSLDDSILRDALDWVVESHPPVELAHPAALAAAAVGIACTPECRSLWDRVFALIGYREPNQGSKPLSDLSTNMVDCIALANRSNNPHRAATKLYSRARMLTRLWLAQPDQIRMALPRAPKNRPLDALWTNLEVNFRPRIIFDGEGATQAPDKDSDGSDGQQAGSAAGSNRNKPGPEAARNRLATGQKAEEWFQKNFQSACTSFKGAALVDCRNRQSGYDFKLELGQESWYVEIKALADDAGAIRLSDCQWERAKLEGEKYFLVAISGIHGDRPQSLVIRDPATYLKPRRREVLVRRVEWELNLSELRAATASNTQRLTPRQARANLGLQRGSAVPHPP